MKVILDNKFYKVSGSFLNALIVAREMAEKNNVAGMSAIIGALSEVIFDLEEIEE